MVPDEKPARTVGGRSKRISPGRTKNKTTTVPSTREKKAENLRNSDVALQDLLKISTRNGAMNKTKNSRVFYELRNKKK